MEYLNLQTILLAISGMVIHVLMFVLSKCKGKNKFQLSVWLQDSMNWIRIILSLVSTFVLFLMLDNVATMLNVSVEGHDSLLNIVAFAIGYFNHSLIKNILKLFKGAIDDVDISSE